jgi:hypothetical protein
MGADMVENADEDEDGGSGADGSDATVEQLAQSVRSTQSQLERERGTSEDLMRRMRKLEDRLASVEDRLVSVEAENNNLRTENDHMRSKIEILDEKTTNISGLVTSEFHHGKVTESDAQHHEVAARYRQFRDQEMLPIVECLDDPVSQAQALAKVSIALFTDEYPTEDELRQVLEQIGLSLTDENVRRICIGTRKLREEAKSLGRQQQWDFQSHPGDPYDSERQERMAGSVVDHPDEVVGLVVAPGYVYGDGKAIVPQTILTILRQGASG